MIDYDLAAAEYARHRRVHPEVLRSLVEVGGIDRDSRVLEVGCGTGNYIIALERLTHCAGWGLEPSEQMLAQARGRSTAVQFQVGRAEQMGLEDDSFEQAFSVDVIHHVQDRPAYFREAQRVLRAGGRVCTVTDSAWIICQRQPLSVYFPETVALEMARYPRVAELAAMMAQAGFVGIEQRMVEFPYQIDDIQPFRDRAFSCLHLLPEAPFQQGLARMEADLARGPLQGVSRYVLLWGRKP